MMQLGYVIIYVPQVANTMAFYEKAFGLKQWFLHESGDYGEMETGATRLAFASEALRDGKGINTLNNRPTDKPAGVEIALVASDVTAQYKKAVANGATAIKKSTSKPWGQIVAYVRDNNGFLVELCSPMD